MMTTKYLFILTTVACVLLAGKLNGQIKKEVEVVKPYVPVVSDAQKINELPVISDSVVVKPVFQYNITPTPVTTEFQVQPISAAKMVSLPLQPLLKSYLKLGMGNYTTPMGELYINSLRSKENSVGVYVRHQSSSGEVTLENDKSVYAGYANTHAELFGKHFVREGYIYGSARYGADKSHYYGYNPALTNVSLNKNNIMQRYTSGGAKAGYASTRTDYTNLNYQGELDYNYFADKTGCVENQVNINTSFNRQIDKRLYGLNANLKYLSQNSKLNPAGYGNYVFNLNPYLDLSTAEYKLNVGGSLVLAGADNKTYFKLYPKVDFRFVVYQDIVIPFLGLSGEMQSHSYADIAGENPFIRPDLRVGNSNQKLSFYGGVKGSLGKKASYTLKLNFQSIGNQYFFINDTSNVLQNQFTVAYSDVDILSPSFEANYELTEALSFGAKANMYRYSLNAQKFAWHQPSYDLSFSTVYNLRNKIIVNLDVFAISERKALKTAGQVKTLGSAIDFNLGAEYRYTKVLSFWLHFNNFTASRYQLWNQYPIQRFNMMAGFSYSL